MRTNKPDGFENSRFYQAISKQYDAACEDFRLVFVERNLCEHQDKHPYCFAQQTNEQCNSTNLHMCCCYGCRHWSKDTHSCSTLSLSCRGWICHSIEKKLKKQNIDWMDISKSIYKKYPLLELLSWGSRTDKEYDLEYMYRTSLSLKSLIVLYDLSVAMGHSDETFIKVIAEAERKTFEQLNRV